MASIRKKRTNLMRLMPVLIVIIALLIVMGCKGFELKKKNALYASRINELNEEYQEEKDREQEIKEYEAYVKTDEFKKEVLREKFNYADKNEIVFRFSKS